MARFCLSSFVLFTVVALMPMHCNCVELIDPIEAALQYARSHDEEFLVDLMKLASIPSISALPQHRQDIRNAADFLVARLRQVGLQNVQLLEAGEFPAVYGDWFQGSDAPTVLVYGHYDVQPADPFDLWSTPPFKPTIKDGVIYGRGVDDNKGTFLPAVQAVESILDTSKQLPLNLKFLLEGQEEIGSPDLEAMLAAHRDLLATDYILSADGSQVSRTQPGVILGFRGAIALEVELRTLAADVHSGVMGGGVLNPALALSRLLSGLHFPNGSVAVEGFYDVVQPISEEDKDDLAQLSELSAFDERYVLHSVGAVAGVGEEGFSLLERTCFRPTCDVIGMYSGFTGEGVKTIVPARAVAKLSCRLVPDQTPSVVSQLVTAHLLAHAPLGANISVQSLGFNSSPYVVAKHALANVAATKVLTQVMGRAPVFMRSGGSIPALAAMKAALGVDATVFAFGLPDDQIHAPNERYPLDMYALAREAYIKMLFELAKLHSTARVDSPSGEAAQQGSCATSSDSCAA